MLPASSGWRASDAVGRAAQRAADAAAALNVRGDAHLRTMNELRDLGFRLQKLAAQLEGPQRRDDR